MAINRIGGPGGTDPLPEPGSPKKSTPTGGPSFADTLALTMRTQLEDELRTADATAVVNSLLAWYGNPANLVMAMSIIAAMEIGRREAIREEMLRRDQDARMTELLRHFDEAAKRV